MEKRMVRGEMDIMRRLGAFLSELYYIQDGMQERLEAIGKKEKLAEMIEDTVTILKELLATATPNQQDSFRKGMKDYKIVLKPSLTPQSTSVLLTKDQAEKLVDFAQERCKMCVLSNEEAKSCELYKWMESLAITDHYNTLSCPYALAEWE